MVNFLLWFDLIRILYRCCQGSSGGILACEPQNNTIRVCGTDSTMAVQFQKWRSWIISQILMYLRFFFFSFSSTSCQSWWQLLIRASLSSLIIIYKDQIYLLSFHPYVDDCHILWIDTLGYKSQLCLLWSCHRIKWIVDTQEIFKKKFKKFSPS